MSICLSTEQLSHHFKGGDQRLCDRVLVRVGGSGVGFSVGDESSGGAVGRGSTTSAALLSDHYHGGVEVSHKG